MQMATLAVALLLMALIVLAFVQAVLKASAVDNAGPHGDDGGTERRRGSLVVGLVVVGIVVSLASLWRWPHAVRAAPPALSVNVTGGQWYWKVDRTELPLGKPVVFNVSTADVTHGAGIVDPEGRILAQTQAMPGYVNRFELTFDRPGTYRVICLEYCGVAHHGMVSEFKVLAQGGN